VPFQNRSGIDDLQKKAWRSLTMATLFNMRILMRTKD